ncbi:MAG: protein kinase [Coriobacteriales bacterium]|nr:protein kinase [Coriobacteriales bacterium]
MDESQLIKALDRDDSYRTIRVLGDGPSGRTELVRGLKAELLVRKRIPKELANERSWMTIRTMSHPLLPQVRDLYWLPDELVVILTYIDGITLGEMVRSTGPLSVSEVINYLDDLCVAVGALHARGIVHRDLSPNNVVVSGGSARIIDLGNARIYVEGARHDTTRLGTWGYAAPEQFGFAQTDARSDVFGLGSLLGFLLTGVNPGDETFDKALADEARVPFVLRLVVERARAFEPSARYQTAADFMTAVRAAVPEYATIRPIPLDEMRAAPSAPAGDIDQPKPFDRTRRSEEPRRPAEQKRPNQPTRQAEAFPMRIVRWFFPTLPVNRRAWTDLRHLEKALVVLLWATYLFVGIPITAGFLDAPRGHIGFEAIAYYTVSIVWSLTFILLVREAHLLLTCLGPGRDTKGILKCFATRAFVLVAFCLALSVLAVYAALIIEKFSQ